MADLFGTAGPRSRVMILREVVEGRGSAGQISIDKILDSSKLKCQSCVQLKVQLTTNWKRRNPSVCLRMKAEMVMHGKSWIPSWDLM